MKEIGGKYNDGIWTMIGKMFNYSKRKYFVITDSGLTYS